MATPPDFTAGQVLTAAQMNQIGLWHVSRTTIGTTVANVTVSNAFSSDFDNYKVVISNVVASTAGGQSLQFRFGSAKNTAYYGGGQSLLSSGTLNSHALNNSAQVFLCYMQTTVPNRMFVSFDVLQPEDATTATGLCGWGQGLRGGTWFSYVYETAETVTDIYIQTSTGTITGGFIDVYGYRGP